MTERCAHCRESFDKPPGWFKYQRKKRGDDTPFYCGQKCTGLAKRSGKTKEQLIAEKAEYDRQYREREAEMLAAKKRDYFQRTYDRKKAREIRKQRAEWQRAYGKRYRQSPEWIEHKTQYDLQMRASEYGDFGEAWKVLVELEREVQKTPWYERAVERGYFNPINQKRKDERQTARLR